MQKVLQADAIMHLRQGNTTMNIIDLHGGPLSFSGTVVDRQPHAGQSCNNQHDHLEL